MGLVLLSVSLKPHANVFTLKISYKIINYDNCCPNKFIFCFYFEQAKFSLKLIIIMEFRVVSQRLIVNYVFTVVFQQSQTEVV